MTTERNPAPVREPYDAMGPVDAPNPPAARATLADVQPGRRVRLGDQALRVFSAGRWTYDGTGQSFSHEEMDAAAFVVYRDAALSAQPSPGGQDVLFIEELAELRRLVPSVNQKHALDAAIAALAVRQPVTMDDALAAGDGTLHGAINHWQERALRAEAELAARQPVGEPVAKSVGIDALVRLLEDEAAECEKAWTERADTYMSGRASGFLLAADYFRKIATSQRWSEFLSSPAQAVDLGKFRAQVAELLRREFDLEVADPGDHRHDDGAEEADRIAGTIAALIDSQAVGK